MSSKAKLRADFLFIRNSLSLSKRHCAESRACQAIKMIVNQARFVLSYVPFKSELNISQLNHTLAEQNKLVLPKMEGQELRLFQVQDPTQGLIPHSYGFLEPCPKTCQEIDPAELSYLIVPGLAFDQNSYRLGYGKGFYDRFLAKLPASVLSLGVGFIEQHCHSLPAEAHDMPLSRVLLF